MNTASAFLTVKLISPELGKAVNRSSTQSLSERPERAQPWLDVRAEADERCRFYRKGVWHQEPVCIREKRHIGHQPDAT